MLLASQVVFNKVLLMRMASQKKIWITNHKITYTHVFIWKHCLTSCDQKHDTQIFSRLDIVILKISINFPSNKYELHSFFCIFIFPTFYMDLFWFGTKTNKNMIQYIMNLITHVLTCKTNNKQTLLTYTL